MLTMQAMLPCNLAFLAIAGLFYTWRDLYVPRMHKNTQLHARVSYLLWIAASRVDSDVNDAYISE